ncbi:MAG: hypothetical protein MZW92_68145 [Comamonadaceae bacterium]|nr:hypothetical protein [Comamonadaceae bacterium]
MRINEERLLENLRYAFTNRSTVLTELMQNARRAKASFVAIDYDGEHRDPGGARRRGGHRGFPGAVHGRRVRLGGGHGGRRACLRDGLHEEPVFGPALHGALTGQGHRLRQRAALRGEPIEVRRDASHP